MIKNIFPVIGPVPTLVDFVPTLVGISGQLSGNPFGEMMRWPVHDRGEHSAAESTRVAPALHALDYADVLVEYPGPDLEPLRPCRFKFRAVSGIAQIVNLQMIE